MSASTPAPRLPNAADYASANVSPDDYGATFSHACALRDANDLVTAADRFGQLCVCYPQRLEAFKALGYVLYQLGSYDQARATLLFASVQDPTDPVPLFIAAASLHRAGGDVASAREIAADALDVARGSHRHARLQAAAQHLIDATESR